MSLPTAIPESRTPYPYRHYVVALVEHPSWHWPGEGVVPSDSITGMVTLTNRVTSPRPKKVDEQNQDSHYRCASEALQ